MSVILSRLLPLMLQLLAGVGIAEVMDKVLPDKVPGYQALSPLGDNKSPLKAIKTIGVLVVGVGIVMFIGKKLRIKLLSK